MGTRLQPSGTQNISMPPKETPTQSFSTTRSGPDPVSERGVTTWMLPGHGSGMECRSPDGGSGGSMRGLHFHLCCPALAWRLCPLCSPKQSLWPPASPHSLALQERTVMAKELPGSRVGIQLLSPELFLGSSCLAWLRLCSGGGGGGRGGSAHCPPLLQTLGKVLRSVCPLVCSRSF